MWQALCLNLGASLSALIGVCVGVASGSESEEAQKYLIAFAAGGFLYIALAGAFCSPSLATSLLQLIIDVYRYVALSTNPCTRCSQKVAHCTASIRRLGWICCAVHSRYYGT